MPTTTLPDLLLTPHTFRVPLDYAQPGGEQISLFARELVTPDRAGDDLPWLLFLQGGPGGLTTRPTGHEDWMTRALREYRVLLMDQRGTGLSTPVTTRTLLRRGDAPAIAAYLKHFRADNIVRDAEAIRMVLTGGARWSILGQSYGGFCAGTYLSFANQGLAEVYMTGGMPPDCSDPDAVYKATYQTVREKNARFYARYPEDAARARDLADYLAQHDVRLPDGAPLTVRRFQQLGFKFGTRDGLEEVHYILERAMVDGAPSHEFGLTMMGALTVETSPIFAILHEACYTQGRASRWSAERLRAGFAEFDAPAPAPVLFTGEMIYPWMFEDYPQLRPLRGAAQILAETEDWPALYDARALRDNTVPVVAAVYGHDMYVDRGLSLQRAAGIGSLKVWESSAHEHDGLRMDGAHVLGTLIDLMRGAHTAVHPAGAVTSPG